MKKKKQEEFGRMNELRLKNLPFPEKTNHMSDKLKKYYVLTVWLYDKDNQFLGTFQGDAPTEIDILVLAADLMYDHCIQDTKIIKFQMHEIENEGCITEGE
jgi:hypothetical protein